MSVTMMSWRMSENIKTPLSADRIAEKGRKDKGEVSGMEGKSKTNADEIGEVLLEQVKLLHERSKECTEEDADKIAALTDAMVRIAENVIISSTRWRTTERYPNAVSHEPEPEKKRNKVFGFLLGFIPGVIVTTVILWLLQSL